MPYAPLWCRSCWCPWSRPPEFSIYPYPSRAVKVQPATSVVLDMSDFVQDAINHYVTVTKSDREPKLAQTPFCPPGSLLASDWEVVGELEKGCHSVVMKNMWVARTARPDLIKPCNDLAGHLHKWSRNCDKYIARTIGYMKRSKNFTLKGYVGDPLSDC